MTEDKQTPEVKPKPHKPGPTERRRLRALREGRVEESAPRRAPGPRPVATGRRTRLEVQTGAMLVQINLGAMMACAMAKGAGLPLDPEKDPLQPNEIVLLARGIAAQAEAHATFRRYLTAAIAVSGSAGFLSVVVAIVTVRLAQHGVLPAEAGGYASLALMADPADVQDLIEQIERSSEEGEAA